MLKKQLNAVDGETLWDMDLGQQQFCIKGFLPKGLCTLGGASLAFLAALPNRGKPL